MVRRNQTAYIDLVDGSNYKRLVELSPEPIVVHADGIIVFINRAGAKLFASSPKKLIGQPIIQFVHSDYVELAKSRMEQILVKRKPTDLVEQKFVAYDGKIIDVEVRATPINYQGKKAALLLFRDITAKKQLERILRESDTQYRQLILSCPQPIVIHNHGIVVFINIAASKMFGFSYPEEAIGENIYDYIQPPFQDIAKKRVEDASNSIHVGFAEHKMIRVDGKAIDVEVSSVKAVTYQGKPMIQSVLQDVTERKRTEEIIRTSEKLSVLGQLAAGIAHEIRNPLTTLKGFIQLLSKRHEHTEHFDIMLSEIERINLIANEFMCLARPTSENFQPKNVCVLVQQIITLLESQANMYNIQIQTGFVPERVWISCVEDKIKQVFLNIMKNAFEAMSHGGNLLLEIEPNNQTKMVAIRFTDSGEGIAEEDIAKLGTPFYTTKETGTGLGLMVCKNIILFHKGGLHISSEIGAGTVVEVILPSIHVN